MTTKRFIRSQRRGAAAGVGLLASLVLVTACGSSSSSTASGSSSSPAAGSPTAQTSSAGNSAVTAADAFLKPYLTAPTALPVPGPLKAKPVAGKTIVYISCALPQCTDITSGVKDAAKAVGWKSKILSFDSTNPATLVTSMQQALQLKPKPDYVVISGLPQAIWGGEEAAYKAANVPLIALALGPAKTGSPLIANLSGQGDAELQGKILANWIISDSHGTGQVLQQDVPAYPAIGGVGTGIRDELSSACPSCKVTTLDITAAQLAQGGTVPAIVSALQRDPSIGYVAASDIAVAPGLRAALNAAGLKKVKIVGGYADAPAVQSLSNGTGTAFTVINSVYQGWAAVDVALRNAEGDTVPTNDGGMPQMLLLANNVASSGAPDNYPPGYQAKFRKLWQVS